MEYVDPLNEMWLDPEIENKHPGLLKNFVTLVNM